MIEVSGIDYQRFRMFLLSVLWRAALSKDKFFSEVTLGSHHENKLREMILTDIPGEPYEYPCVLTLIRPGTLPVQTMDGLIMNPERGRQDAHTWYRFVFGSIIWHYCVSSHSNELEAGKLFLTRAGVLKIPVRQFDELPFLTSAATTLWETGKLSAIDGWNMGNTKTG